MAELRAARKACALRARADRLQAINGGSSETAVKELAVSPTGRPAASDVVTTVTPVVNRPSAFRSSRGSAAGAWDMARALIG